MRRDRRTIMHKMRMMLWALSAVVMVACVREDEPAGPDPDPNGDGLIQADDAYDLFFQFQYDSDTASTRAGSDGLMDGERREHAIGVNGNFVLFFNQENKFIFLAPLTRYIHEHEGKDGAKPEDIEAIYKSRFFTKRRDLTLSCLVLLNAMPLYPQLETLLNRKASLSEVLEMKWPSTSDPFDPLTIGRDGVFFTMSNAVYLNEKKELQTAVKISKDNLVIVEDDSELLKDPDPAKVVRVPVERMVAKFSLNIEAKELPFEGKIEEGTYKDASGKVQPCYYFYAQTNREDRNPANWTSDEVEVFTKFDETTGIQITEPRKWRARITGWGVNALEKKAYLFKHVSDAPDAYSYFSNRLNNWNWNDPERKRTYWAECVNYKKNPKDYPWQYRTAIDAASYPTMKESNGYSYANKTDNLLLNRGYEYYRDKEFARSVYVPENTYDYFTDEDTFETYLDGRPHLLAGTHIVICAELQIQQEENGEYKTFNGFRDRIGNYYWADKEEGSKYNHTLECFLRLMRTFNYYLSSQKEMRYVYYDWGYDGEGTPNTAYYAKPINVSGDAERKFEIFWEEKPGEPSTARRMFGDNNEFLLESFVDQFRNNDNSSDKMQPQCFTQAFIKAGDGKVLPWVDGLRIYDVYSESDGQYEVAKIPVYDKSDVEIAAMIEKHIAEIQEKVKAAETPDDPYYYFKKNGLDWVNSEVNKEIYYAREREDYRKQLLNEILPTHYVRDNDRRSMLFDWLSSVDFFCDGMMYYAAEVKNPAGGGESPYGTVRNNWYKFNLTGINRVGTSLSEHGEAIVPNVIATNDQISFNVQVIGWNPVDMGKVILPI